MTRKEAILLSAYTGFLFAPDFSEVHKFCEDILGRPIWTHEFADRCVQKEIQEKLRPQIMELVQNIAALRPVSREQVEKVWPGCEACKNAGLAIGEVQFYGPFEGSIDVSGNMQYCPNCGRPITPAAQEGQLERLEALEDAD